MPREPVSAHDSATALGRPDDTERAVLECVVDLHPIQLTLAELVRELTDTPEDFASRDRIEIAVQQLAGAGLLHRHGQFVLPTRALMRAIELGVS
jgi:hypothetical protein